MTRSRRLWIRMAVFAVFAAATLVPLGATPPSKATVLERARLGGFAEDLAFVPSGPFGYHIVFVEGYEIWGIPGQGTAQQRARKLFDLYALDPVPRPTGIAYVESRKLFVVNDSGPRNFYFVDSLGRPEGGVSMVFPLPDGYTPNYIEGMTYVPPTAGEYPDHLVMVAENINGTADLLVVDLAGSVKKHFAPHCFDSSNNPITGAGSVEYLPGDRLLLSDSNSQTLCIVDFDGASSAPAVFVDTVGGIGEGVTRLANGRIVATENPQNLLFFDADLNRLPAADRYDVVGLGLYQSIGLAWDAGSSRHLVSYYQVGFPQPSAIAAVPPKLDTATRVVDLTSWPGYVQNWGLGVSRMTYLAQEGRVALADVGRGPVTPPAGWTGSDLPWLRGLLLADPATGNLVEQIDLCRPSAGICTHNYGSQQPPTQWGRANRVGYIPGSTAADRRFAVLFQVGVSSGPGLADMWTVYLFDRQGISLGSIDLNDTAGVTNVAALESFDPGDGSGARFAIVGWTASSSDPQLLITDLSGNRLDSLNVRTELGLPTPTEVSVITTGKQKGAFAVADNTAQTLVVFRVN